MKPIEGTHPIYTFGPHFSGLRFRRVVADVPDDETIVPAYRVDPEVQAEGVAWMGRA